MARPCALTIGNFDGVHLGHQAMLALLNQEAQQRGLPSCVMTFEPHPRDYFCRRLGKPLAAPARIATLRDRLIELKRCGIDQVLVLRFDAHLAALSPERFVSEILVAGLNAKYVLVGDDFRFGAHRSGDYHVLDAAGARHGFDVARMPSFEFEGQRVSSSALREALHSGNLEQAATLMGRPYSVSGHVVHGRKLGRELGFRTLNLRFAHDRPAVKGVFVVQTQDLTPSSLPGVASLGVRPAVEQAGAVLLEVHCLTWPDHLGLEGAYGRCVRVDLLHKLRDEKNYDSLDALKAGIAQDVLDARHWLDLYRP